MNIRPFYPYYDITVYYDIGDRFHYNNDTYEVVQTIHPGDKLVIYDDSISYGNVILLS